MKLKKERGANMIKRITSAILVAVIIMGCIGGSALAADTLQWAIQPRFAWVGEFHEGLAAASLDGRTYGFIDTSGQFVIEPKFGNVYEEFTGGGDVGSGLQPDSFARKTFFSEGLAATWIVEEFGDNMKWGYIDKKGNTAIPFNYANANSFQNSHNAALVLSSGEDSRAMIIDKSGKVTADGFEFRATFALQTNDLTFDREGIMRSTESILGHVDFMNPRYIDTKGNTVSKPLHYDVPFAVPDKWNYATFEVHDEFVIVRDERDETIWFADRSGNVIKDFNNEGKYFWNAFSDGLISFITSSGERGYMDGSFNDVLTFTRDQYPFYGMPGDFHEGYASVGIRDADNKVKYGFIAKPVQQSPMGQYTFRMTTPFMFDNACGCYYSIRNNTNTAATVRLAMVVITDSFAEVHLFIANNLKAGDTQIGYFATQFLAENLISKVTKTYLVWFDGESDMQSFVNAIPLAPLRTGYLPTDLEVEQSAAGTKWIKDIFGINVNF